MKKFAIALVLITLLCSSCSFRKEDIKNRADGETASMSEDLSKLITRATEEFNTVFLEFTNIDVSETFTMSREDEHFMMEFAYTSDNGDGIYGFDMASDGSGGIKVVMQGGDVTIQNYVNHRGPYSQDASALD